MIKFSKVLRVWGTLCASGLVAMLLYGCASNAPSGHSSMAAVGAAEGTNALSAPQGATQAGTEILAVGDIMSVVYNDLPMLQPPFEGQIKSDGTITLILNQKFQAAGKTRSQLEQDIRDRYVPNYFKNMTVTINVRSDTRLYYLGGEVRSPGGRIYVNRITVLKAIQSAGDFTDFANRKKVKLTRADGSKPIIINVLKVLSDPSKDVEVYPGDTIHVPRKIW